MPRWPTVCFLISALLLPGNFYLAAEEPSQPESEELAGVGETRQRPGEEPKPVVFPPYIYESLEPIESSASDFGPVRDRWRQFYAGKWYDPYNQNVLKGDVPVFGEPGEEWFFEAQITSDSVIQRSKIALPVGGPSTSKPGRLNTIGNGMLTGVSQNLITQFALIRGNTSFKPPDYELRIAPVFNLNYAEVEERGVLRIDPTGGTTRDDGHIGFLELFLDLHIADITDRYDFISSRTGIQSFQSDFRGFVYADEQPGVRFFGNYDNNRWQSNLAWFHRLDKDTNSGINTTFDDRYEDVFVGNLYHQDAPVLGHQLSGSVIYRMDQAGDHGEQYDENGFLRRPAAFGDERSKNIYSTYLGLAGDGHFGRVNSTNALYYVFGTESHNQIPGQGTDISAWMFAQEFSYDIDWTRLRASFFWASGDSDPLDGDAEGFDSINDVPNFAGGELSFWQSQQIPFIAGGEVFLVNRESFLPNLRPGKELGQSNFVNPGLFLYNIGVDFDLTPKLKLVNNLSYLRFDDTATLQVLRQDGTFGHTIGYDLSTGLIYRPFLNNNVQLMCGASTLFPGNGIETLYGDENMYNFFGNVILQY